MLSELKVFDEEYEDDHGDNLKDNHDDQDNNQDNADDDDGKEGYSNNRMLSVGGASTHGLSAANRVHPTLLMKNASPGLLGGGGTNNATSTSSSSYHHDDDNVTEAELVEVMKTNVSLLIVKPHLLESNVADVETVVKFIKNILECFPALKVTREGRFTMKELTARKIFTEVGNSSATSTSTLAQHQLQLQSQPSQPSRDSKVEVPWLVVEFSEEELTWSAFNYTVIGSPDPNVAFEGSIRKSLQDNAGQFGLSKAAFNLIHNGIHASNGPLGAI
jgi:hypothetical protein